MWVGVAVLVGMMLAPPWATAHTFRSGASSSLFYAPIWRPPLTTREMSVFIDWSRLFAQVVGVVALTAAAVVTLREKR